MAFTFLYGSAGAVNAAIAGITGAASPALNFLYTPAGVIAAEITFFTPFVVRPLLASFAVLPRAQLDVAASLGASPLRVLRSVVMPEAWPALVAGGSLVLLLTLNEFGIVLFTGAKGVITLPVLIYTRGIVTFDLPGAAVIATVQIALSLSLYGAVPAGVRPADERSRKGGHRCCCGAGEVGRSCSAGFALVVLVVFVAPLATVVIAGLAGSWTEALPSDLGFGSTSATRCPGENLASLSVSLQTAFIAGGLALVLGTWAALAAREAPRWLGRVTDAVFHLPIAVPSVAIGLGLLIAFNSRPLLLGGTRWIVILAHAVLVLAFAFSAVSAALDRLDPAYRQAAESLGAGPGPGAAAGHAAAAAAGARRRGRAWPSRCRWVSWAPP